MKKYFFQKILNFKGTKFLSESFEKLFNSNISNIQNILESLEEILLKADVGFTTTNFVLNILRSKIKIKNIKNKKIIKEILKEELLKILSETHCQLSKFYVPSHNMLYCILILGVNGVGKTTIIAKIAKYYKDLNLKVALAAGDTFRAASIEQIQFWGKYHKIPVIAQSIGSDSASVIFDAIQFSYAKNIDVIIADTAGRLHNRKNLMHETQKITKVISKFNSKKLINENMLILDAGIGQNSFRQVEEFKNFIKIDSLSLTKLDGTAKGGIIFSITKELKIPIRFISFGENINDFQEFKEKKFVDNLFKKTI